MKNHPAKTLDVVEVSLVASLLAAIGVDPLPSLGVASHPATRRLWSNTENLAVIRRTWRGLCKMTGHSATLVKAP
jgi:hypothetical protein